MANDKWGIPEGEDRGDKARFHPDGKPKARERLLRGLFPRLLSEREIKRKL